MNKRRFVLLFAFCLLAPVGAIAQDQADQQPTPAECTKLCGQDADNVPASCDCSEPVGMGGGDGAPGNLTVAELLDKVRAAYIERMATVENYWIVEASDSSPYPITRYFERKPGTDSSDPTYLEVPPDELARREMLNDPRLSEEEKQAFSDPAAIYGAYGDAMEAFGEVTGEATGGATSAAFEGIAEAFRGVEEGAQAYKAKREAEATGFEDVPHFVRSLEENLSNGNYSQNIKLIKGVYFPLLPLSTRTFGERDCDPFMIPDRVRFVTFTLEFEWICGDFHTWYNDLSEQYEAYAGSTGPMPNPALGIPSYIHYFLNDVEVEVDGIDYTVEKGSEFWIGSGLHIVYYKLKLLTLDNDGFGQMDLEREMFIHRPVGPMVMAREIRERIKFKDLVERVVEEHKSIRSAGFNQGPPTQEQIQHSTW